MILIFYKKCLYTPSYKKTLQNRIIHDLKWTREIMFSNRRVSTEAASQDSSLY